MQSKLAVLVGLIVIAACPASAVAQRDTPLRVVRVTPGNDPTPLTRITVTFDRPVAGSLDRTVDATTILRVTPAIAGKIEWRDPVTIRLTPSALLTPGTQYTVTVANNFRAMDGSALAEPYGFTFRVRGPTLLTGFPVGPLDTGRRAFAGIPRAEHVVPNQKLELVYSAPVDLKKLTAASYIELNATCAGPRIIRLSAESQRRIRKDDRTSIEQAGGYDRDRSADSLRRVVLLTPQSPLPHGCVADLVAPLEVEDPPAHGVSRFNFATYGDLRLSVERCTNNATACPTGPLVVTFTNPVRGAEVMRRLHVLPETKFTVRDTSAEATEWRLEATLKPRTGYAVVADTAIRDVFGQGLTGNPAAGARTTGYTPSINHPFGRLLVERVGAHTLAVQHVNIDTLIATIVPVPDSLEARVLNKFAWGNDTLWNALIRTANVVRIPVHNVLDRPTITGVRIPTLNAMRAGTPALFAVKIDGRAAGVTTHTDGAPALVQVTDLGVHAKIGVADGVVWVTGVNDGKPKSDAAVVLFNAQGKRVAATRTNAEGLARFERLTDPTPNDTTDDEEDYRTNFEGYVSVTLGTDRAITAINRYDPDLSPYRFNVYSAWGDSRLPVAGAMFTERGIYRPGERVYAKAIVRNGNLGALRAPAAGDSINWRFHDREDGMLREVTTTLSSFGTADQSVVLPTSASVGYYSAEIRVKRQGRWRSIGGTSYRVAEYRPPEFLVDVTAPTASRMPGDKFAATVQARYLFGAPMGGAVVQWSATQTPVSSWELEIPNTDGAYIGESGSWWEEGSEDRTDVFQSKTDTLDARGARTFSVTLPATPKGRAASVTIEATVTDINRQTVSSRTTTLVHPAEFYIAAKPTGTDYFWKANTPQSIAITTVRPDGQKVAGIRVDGTIARREWHRVRRERNGYSQLVGEWVTDTIARCTVTSATTATPCTFSAKEGGMYILTFTAKDAKGHAVKTSFYRWAEGAGWVPWSDESQFKMDVIPDKQRYSVGDIATVLFASPFTNAEAWITIEREGLIEQRRIRITSGSTTLKLPITEAFAPNVFVSILVARGRSAPPGKLDDAGRPTIRVGYAELRVIPEVKRLTVTVAAERAEYRPADSARARIQVRDAQGRGQRSEVTLWAVDEGVLSLTGYKTPDPLELIYQERGLGMRLASNMTTVAPQIPEGEKGRSPGGGGGAAGADVLRSRFQTTAFFLGTVVTDAQGNVVAGARLPDNITTFRLMAVAVTAGDRYGKGQSSMLVTRPLLARQALPRFVRPGDQFMAGAVINRRDGSSVTVKVKATSTGATLRGDAEQTATLAAQRGSEVRFPFLATRTDSASFRFDVSDATNADAVRVTIPVRPDHHPVTHTLAGVVSDSTSTVQLALPAGMDLDRSRLSLSVGTSPLATIRGIQRTLRIYPYDCTEQVTSAAIPLIALYRAQMQGGAEKLKGNPRAEIARAVAVLSGRQRADGGIGYWSSTDWSSAWLSAYAGMVLLDAREAANDVKVDTMVLSKLAGYLTTQLHNDSNPEFTPIGYWRELRLREQVAAVDFLSRYGRPDVAAENELYRTATQLTLEDRARLAEALMRRKQAVPARRLMEATWATIRVEGHRAVLPDTNRRAFYFESRMRPLARVLTATLAVDPTSALIGPMVETLAMQNRAGGDWTWNTQDFASTVSALAAFERRQRKQADRSVRVRAGDRVIVEGGAVVQAAWRDSSIALTGLVDAGNRARTLTLSVDATPGTGSVYYYLSVTEIPAVPPVTPEIRGIQVERYYERLEGGTPLVSVAEGDLVRVRLRVTVPSTRYFLVLDDALPAGLEAVDLSLRTAATMPGPGANAEAADHEESEQTSWYGSWDSGWWSPFDHRELRDDRVVYSGTVVFPGTYTATYIARATTPGTFIRPPAHAEEMYNPAVNGRSDGGTFIVTQRKSGAP